MDKKVPVYMIIRHDLEGGVSYPKPLTEKAERHKYGRGGEQHFLRDHMIKGLN